MKTLADFKRDIGTGMTIECIEIRERWYDSETNDHAGEWHDRAIAEKMQGPRYVSHVDTTGFYLKQKDTPGRGSHCAYPKASQLSYDGDRFTITETTHKGTEWQKRTYQIIRFN